MKLTTRHRNRIVAAARRAVRRAYSPYSRFRVGAALLAEDGTIFSGSNVENASYGLTVCAERVAIQSAVAAGQRRFIAIAIAANGPSLPRPCGACRQVLAEFCRPEFLVLVADGSARGGVETFALNELLPAPFVLKHDRRRV